MKWLQSFKSESSMCMYHFDLIAFNVDLFFILILDSFVF